MEEEPPAGGADDHRRGRQQRNEGRRTDTGKEDVHVRIARADERPRGRVQEVGCVDEPELEGEQQEEQREERSEVPGGRCIRGHAVRWQHQVPAQPMQDRHHDEGEQRKRDEEVEQRRETGQGEQVKAQVAAEKRVRATHRRAVCPCEEGHPERRRRDAHHEGHQERAQEQRAREGARHVELDATTTVDEECGKTSGPSPRPPDVAVENAERNDRARDEQGDTPAQRREEHRLELHLSEPEPVGGESGDPWKHQDDEEQRAKHDEPDAPRTTGAVARARGPAASDRCGH